MSQSLDVIVPVFNEIECLPELVSRIETVGELALKRFSLTEVNLITVDDGSIDGSSTYIQNLDLMHVTNKHVKLRRNFGHQIAVAAGLNHSKADFVAIIDADLQDPPEYIIDMLEMLINQDQDLVFGKRISRDGETRFKRTTAGLFYRFIRYASGIDVPLDTGDFRVMKAKVRDELNQLPERHRIIRLLIPWLGFSGVGFPYSRASRFAGNTKYSTRQMIRLASHAVFSFSTIPVRLIQVTGATLIVIGFLTLFGNLAIDIFLDGDPWISNQVAWQTFLAGIITSAVALNTGYSKRIQDQVQGRPLFTLDELKPTVD